MVSLSVVFMLAVIHCNLVLSDEVMKIHQKSSDEHVKKKHNLSHGRVKREKPQCPEEEYTGHKYCCKKCNKGNYVASECSAEHGESVCKGCTDGVDYMDKRNGYPECQKCRNCEAEAGQEVRNNCMLIQNTVCKCKDQFFCRTNLSSADEHCDRCLPCDKCDYGIAEPCTTTRNTVCSAKPIRYHYVLWPIFGVIVVGLIFSCIYLYYKKQTGEANRDVTSLSLLPPNPKCPPHLKNTDLETHLHNIAGIMSQNSVLNLVEKKLTTVAIEDCKRNHPNNAHEERYELLKAWYNANGRQGAMKSLLEAATNGEADKIKDLIQQSNAQP